MEWKKEGCKIIFDRMKKYIDNENRIGSVMTSEAIQPSPTNPNQHTNQHTPHMRKREHDESRIRTPNT
jgi:hypothetical protein